MMVWQSQLAPLDSCARCQSPAQAGAEIMPTNKPAPTAIIIEDRVLRMSEASHTATLGG